MNAGVGNIVRVTFWDHMENGAALERITVYGRLREIAPDHLRVDGWEPDDRDEGATTHWHIARGAVIKVERLQLAGP